jgi:hypothetical protein
MRQHHRRLPKCQRRRERQSREEPAYCSMASHQMKPQEDKSLFASFSSEKEEAFFF